jgi:hypothetical protein
MILSLLKAAGMKVASAVMNWFAKAAARNP